jgi:hypothetical protein
VQHGASEEFGTLLSLFSAGAVGTLVGGPLADRFGAGRSSSSRPLQPLIVIYVLVGGVVGDSPSRAH